LRLCRSCWRAKTDFGGETDADLGRTDAKYCPFLILFLFGPRPVKGNWEGGWKWNLATLPSEIWSRPTSLSASDSDSELRWDLIFFKTRLCRASNNWRLPTRDETRNIFWVRKLNAVNSQRQY
jgi:hypothetical protein